MTEKLKLPLSVEYLPMGDESVLVDDAGDIVNLYVAADAINATQRRCDGCAHWLADSVTGSIPWCSKLHLRMDADDYCRKGWEPR